MSRRPLVETGDETEEEAAALKQHRELEADAEISSAAAAEVIMRQRYGRRFVWSILADDLGMFRQQIAADVQATYANNGRQFAAVMLFNRLKTAHPELVKLMITENEIV